MHTAVLLILTGLAVSSVAAYYSIVGLVAIFAASPYSIAIMGAVLEVSKLVATSWLYRNWKTIPKLLRGYFVFAIIILMMITSLGIFGFLSKAHVEQGLTSGDTYDQISLLETRISIDQEMILQYRSDLSILDNQISRFTELGAVSKGIDARKSQNEDRTQIMNTIVQTQKQISDNRLELAPFKSKMRSIEAEVGPIKYIAAFVYGATDEMVLERAVTWVIILIIFVFDPMAVLLIIAGNHALEQIPAKVAPKPVTKARQSKPKKVAKIDAMTVEPVAMSRKELEQFTEID
jgi:hypothetical protein